MSVTDKNSIPTKDFLGNLQHYLRETFEGTTPDGNAFIDKGTGVFDTIRTLSAEDASKSINNSDATIAAHLEHTRFYLKALQEFINGRTEKVNWSESWKIKNIDEKEWKNLKSNLREEYKNALKTFEKTKTWNDDKISDALGIIVHTAYHLGAIRQIFKIIK